MGPSLLHPFLVLMQGISKVGKGLKVGNPRFKSLSDH